MGVFVSRRCECLYLPAPALCVWSAGAPEFRPRGRQLQAASRSTALKAILHRYRSQSQVVWVLYNGELDWRGNNLEVNLPAWTVAHP